MLYNRLGDTGLIVSRLAFGAMTFGKAEGAYAAIFKVGQELANELVARSLDRGVNFFNTADAYANGDSEVMLGRALGARRQDVAIATKVGMRTGEPLLRSGLSRRYVLNAAEDSLRRLGTDYIDVYLVHRPDPHTPIEETVDALDLLVRQGKVRYVGFSNWPAWQAAKAIGVQKARGAEPFRAAEMYYSLVGRDLEHEIVPFARDAGVGIMVWSPLAGGFLSGKYTREDPTGGGGRLTGFDFIPFDREGGYDLVDALREMAKERQSTPAQVALAWLLHQSQVASVLVGASSAAQLDDNLAATEVSLTAAELERLDRMTAPAETYPGWFNRTIFDKTAAEALARSASWGPAPPK
jgi:aryl-alcohol dehydrogenase-like predicted oxidoreductase